MIKKVKWKNYKVLGDLELDFSKSDGGAYSTIILAGENGTGKTTILETIAQFLIGESFEPFDYLDYDTRGDSFHIEPLKEKEVFGFHTRKRLSDNRIDTVRINRNNNPNVMHSDANDIRSYGCVYSSARSNFETQVIKNVTSKHLDDTKYDYDDKHDYTDVKQLMIDVDAQDDKEYKRVNQEDNPTRYVPWSEFEPSSKMFRFKKAFNEFFTNLKYDRIDDTSEKGQRIIFKKHGIDISDSDLSTGEKQIVFRGAYLLKNSRNLSGGTVLIDEPELSMHPIWQEKILSYYKGLFTQNGEQVAQIIIATHSDYVIRRALEDQENTLVIVLTDVNGNLRGESSRTPYVLPRVTVAEINFQAFHIYSIDYHIQLYGYLQKITGRTRIKDMDCYLQPLAAAAGLGTKYSVLDGRTITESLPTHIRNAIDHPDNGSRSYTQEELKQSTDFLIERIKVESTTTHS